MAQEKKGGSFLNIPRLFKKKSKSAAAPNAAEEALCKLPPEVREKVEKEIRYLLSVSHTPQQIFTHLQERGHPAEIFADYINECYMEDFIRDSFTRGFTVEQIREELENWNWPKERIECGISSFLNKK